MKILIVEDDAFYGRQLVEILSDNGVSSILVQSVQEALKSNLDVIQGIIIDVMLPNDPKESGISMEEARAGYLSGVALARRIKSIKPQIPLFLFSAYVSGEAEKWANDNNIQFISKEEGPQGLISALRTNKLLAEKKPRAFIVHGHDELSLLELKNYIQNTLKWDEPIILRQMPSYGKTIIEKFETYSSKADYVFVLMTPDDQAINEQSTNKEKRRARQNVIFELGFFYAQLGRHSGRIIVLHKGLLELPSDTQGIVWIDISNGVETASENIRREIR